MATVNMPDSWETAIEALINALERHVDAICGLPEGTLFENTDEYPMPLVSSPPPPYVEHESPSTRHDFDLSPVDYPNGSGEWRELEELPQYTAEERERAVGDASEDNISANHRSNEYNSAVPRVNRSADSHRLTNNVSFTIMRNDTDADRHIALLGESIFHQLRGLPTSRERNGPFNNSVTDSGIERLNAGLIHRGNGNEAMMRTESNIFTDESFSRTVSVPVVVVTDYDAEQALVSHQPIHVHSDERANISSLTVDWKPSERAEFNSFPELERMVGRDLQVVQPQGSQEIFGLLDYDIEPCNSITADHDETNGFLLDRPDIPRPESRAGHYHIPPIENDDSESATLDEADEHGGLLLPDPEGEAPTDEAISGLLSTQFTGAQWANGVDISPEDQGFTGDWYWEDTDFDDVLVSPTDCGPLGIQDDNDVPWDARTPSVCSFETSSCCASPSYSFSAAPDVFGELASSSGEVETVDYESIQGADTYPEVYSDVASFMESVRAAEQAEILEHESSQNRFSHPDLYNAVAALMENIRMAEEEEMRQHHSLGGPLLL